MHAFEHFDHFDVSTHMWQSGGMEFISNSNSKFIGTKSFLHNT